MFAQDLLRTQTIGNRRDREKQNRSLENLHSTSSHWQATGLIQWHRKGTDGESGREHLGRSRQET
ncbi:hypothetical protein Poly24_09980 [Rosistilla carotiformis]|uniref:Uncharacterized protein n=1 Tax=Rosistilla carotiformis TaxID=2528017 RepID=A0A518JP32_9BACT|nr:hypothetical protein Poly24_09980 [Rosistilla carotiformis]